MCAKMQDVNSNAHSSDIQFEANAHQDITENDVAGSINYISDLDTLSDEMIVTDNDYIQVKQERETENDETGQDDSLIGETTIETRQNSMTGTFSSNIVSKPHASLASATDIGTQINHKIEHSVLNRAAPLMTDQNTYLLQPSTNPAQSLPALGTGIVGSPMLRLGIGCQNCEAIFTNKMEFENHLSNKKCIWVCKLCKKVFVSSYRTVDKDHIYSIFNEKLGKHKNDCDQTCKLCGRSFRESAQYRLHMKRRHSKDKQFACDVCFFDFKSEGAMHSHKMNKHSVDSDVYPCPMCPREYSTLQPLKDHFRSTHLRRKKIEVCCTICGKKCESGRNIKEHEETHKVKDIPCDQCPAMFNTQRLLKTHQRRHKKDYSHFCEVCAKAFYSLTKLKEHHRSHTGEKPYSCPKCDYWCSSSGNFRKHMKIHDNPSSGHQQCSLCQYRCRLKDTLDKHMKIHDKPSSGDHQ